MNKIILRKIEQKIQDTVSNDSDVQELIKLLSSVDDSKSFRLGIVVGRIYNSFYYQSKRTLNREPNKEEFKEFLEFIKMQKTNLDKLW